MDNYIKCYDNVVTDEFCENAVTKFEGDYTQHEQWPKDNIFFTQINLQKSGMWDEEQTHLKKVFEK